MRLRGSIYSQVLGMNTGISIVGPKEFNKDGKYKVVYLLHGLSDNSSNWIDYSMVSVYANQYDAFIIMPEVQRSFYIDMEYGPKYFTYITEELPRICENVFNISSKREDTAVMGCSMGGYGSLRCALLKPEQYGFCGVFSTAFLYLKKFLNGDSKREILEENDWYSIFGNNLEWKPEYEITELINRIENNNEKPIIYSTCGKSDFLYEYNIKFKEAMKEKDFDFTYEEWDGGHDWDFFNESLRRSLSRFLSH